MISEVKVLFQQTVLAIIVLCGGIFGGNTAWAQKYFTIGTGSVIGVYYPTGVAICSMVNKERVSHDIHCAVEITGGSIYNLNAIEAGEIEMGVVQSDTQYQAFKGLQSFAEQGPSRDLRSLFSLHAEAFTVVARADSGIKTFDDLKGKRVNIGNPGSGQRETMEVVMAKKGWSVDDFSLATELKAAEQSTALCTNKIDAIIYTVGHPNGSIREATDQCDSVLVDVKGTDIDALVAQNTYYRKAVIPAGTYRGNDNDIHTFGVSATFVTSARVADEVAYTVVKAVFENFDEFKKQHPAFAHLEKKQMLTNSLSAPLHPGAVRYYKEAGLM